jgi:hypothetical protein
MSPVKKFTALLDKLAAIPPTRAREELMFTLAEGRSLAASGEWGLGLEMVCCNLCEFDFPLTLELFREIESLADEWGINRSWVEPLKRLLP